MTDLKPGDLVVCVDAKNRPRRRWKGDPPIEGNIYTVEAVGLIGITGDECIRVVEITNAPGARGYALWRFRPIRKPSIEVLRRIVERAPDEVTA